MSVFSRIYSDYILPSRLNEYDVIIKSAIENGYNHLTIPQFYKHIKSGDNFSDNKIFIHRHDIDTDVSTAREMFLIEKKYGIKSSFYFRYTTLDVKIMNEIRDYGSEVGYHFEELSDFCKKNRIRTKEKLKPHYNLIRDIFCTNITSIEKRVGFKITTIASHGDFVNRILGISNYDFLTPELMNEVGVEFECYDELLIKNYGTILSDVGYPVFYRPISPTEAMTRGDKKIYLLTHPRHWRSAIFENTKDNIIRFVQGIKYKF